MTNTPIVISDERLNTLADAYQCDIMLRVAPFDLFVIRAEKHPKLRPIEHAVPDSADSSYRRLLPRQREVAARMGHDDVLRWLQVPR